MNLRNVRILGLTGQDRTEMSHVSPYQIYGFGDRNEPCKPILDIYIYGIGDWNNSCKSMSKTWHWQGIDRQE